MRSNRREALLKLAVIVVLGLLLLDKVVISPLISHWREQGESITSLREKVTRGQQLLDREKSIRDRWSDMQLTDLPDDSSVAESDVFKGVARWARESGINFTSLTPQPKTGQDGYDTLECRATATGSLAAVSRLMYELETDRLPARLEECEITARDAKGQQVTLTMRFSFLRLTASNGRSGR
jgi:hypothetical protein